MRIVQPVQTHQAEYGYVVYSSRGALEGFVRHDSMMPQLYRVVGRHVLLQSLTVPIPEFRRLCLMPGVTYSAER